MALPQADDAPGLALALDAFMAEHRRCWRLYGEGLDSGEDGAVLWIDWRRVWSSYDPPPDGAEVPRGRAGILQAVAAPT